MDKTMPACPRVTPLGARFGHDVERRLTAIGGSFATLAASASASSGVAVDHAVLRKAARGQVPMPAVYVEPLATAFGLQGPERDAFVATGLAARSHPFLVALLRRLSAAQGIDLGLGDEDAGPVTEVAAEAEAC